MSTVPFRKGSSLELDTAAYFQAHGYLVRRDIKLSVAAGTAEATDIDLLAIRFAVPLREERLIADCKNRKRPQPFERVLWTLGLASFSHAGQSVVVLPRAPWQAREFASLAGIDILEHPDIDSFLRARDHSYRPFGEADPSLASYVEERRKRAAYASKELVRDDLKLRQMLVTGHPITNLNRIIATLGATFKLSSRLTADAYWYSRYVCFDAAVIASVMLVRFAAESKWTSEPDWSGLARKRLTYGDVSPQKAKQLAKYALDREFFDDLPTPGYSDELLQVIRSLIAQPSVAAVVPYAMDYHLLGRVLGSVPTDYVHPTLGPIQDEALKVVKRILSALAYAAEVPANIWDREVSKAVSPTIQRNSQDKPFAEPPQQSSSRPDDLPNSETGTTSLL